MIRYQTLDPLPTGTVDGRHGGCLSSLHSHRQGLSPVSTKAQSLLLYSIRSTVMHCVADFCVIPMGVEASVSNYIAEAQRVVEKSGLTYKMHGYGLAIFLQSCYENAYSGSTGIEGEWTAVMATIEAVHDRLHELGIPRCATDIRIGTRIDKQGSLEAKVSSVQEILSQKLD